MLISLLLKTGLYKIDGPRIQDWIRLKKYKYLVLALKNKSAKKRKLVLANLIPQNINPELADELVSIVVSDELQISSAAYDLLKDLTTNDQTTLDRIEVAREVLEIRTKKEDNYIQYLSKSGKQNPVLIDKSKMKRLDKLKSQLRNRIG